MNIAIINLLSPESCFLSSCVVKKIKKISKDAIIHWIVKDDVSKKLLSFCKSSNKVNLLDDFNKNNYDAIFNLTPDFFEEFSENVFVSGFNYTKNSDNLKDCLVGNKKTKMNIFQLYHNILDLKWSGESFDVCYYPRSKSKNAVGLAILNNKTKNFVLNNLNIEKKKWIIPYKENILKKFDEINKCKTIITDNFLIMNIALNLRKTVHYIDSCPRNVALEFFNNGFCYEIPNSFLI